MEPDILHEAAAADLQARYEHDLAEAYRRGYADRAAGRPMDPDVMPRIDLDQAIEQAVSDIQAPFFPGRRTVRVWDGNGRPWSFTRADHETRPDWPNALRLEANRPISDREMAQLAHLAAYAYSANVCGNPVGSARRDSAHSFVFAADTSTSRRSFPMVALGAFEMDLDAWLLDGSPLRKTDKAGPGTAGTRAVAGLGDPTLRVAVYYDRTIVES